MKYSLLIAGLVLTVSISFAQVQPGVYNVKQSDIYEPVLSVDSLGADGNSCFIVYSKEGDYVILKVISCWKYTEDSLLVYYDQRVVQRAFHEDEFFPDEEAENYVYKVTEIGADYFTAKSIESPGTIIRWDKRK